MGRDLAITAGRVHPLGATPGDGGVNFAVASRHATQVFVHLFNGDTESHRFALPGRDGDVFHGFIAGLSAGQAYGLSAEGPWDPAAGQLFDAAKLLVDPHATALDRPFRWHADLAARGVDTAGLVPRALVQEGLAPVTRTARPPGVIYEINVRAFTMRHPDVPEALRGTVSALAHPAIVKHLKTLGVDTLQLMPLAAFIDERHLPPLGLANGWGYNPVQFFAPDPRLAPGGVAEIRDTLAALHDQGFQVLLDVVLNHTGESDLQGASLSLRGLDNASTFAWAQGQPVNDTGCGNTLALHQPLAFSYGLAALRHWAALGFDGFRYDLATVMGRSPQGFSPEAPFLAAVTSDPALAPLLHIAEPWDVGPGGYQLGQFPPPFAEWNDRFRDEVRHFWRGDAHAHQSFATRLAGSSDLFAARQRRPSASINFVAAHDGFTLADVVRFDHKDNDANGENNRDGNSFEPCWVSATPEADVAALMATLFLARGTPMLTAGDEMGRSQQGNNNAYAQDNELTWLDWQGADRGLVALASALIAFRRQHASYFADRFLTGTAADPCSPRDAEWFAATGRALSDDGWQAAHLDVLMLALGAADEGSRLLLIFHRGGEAADITLPAAGEGLHWAVADPVFAPVMTVRGGMASIAARSVAVLKEVMAGKGRSRSCDRMVKAVAEAAGLATAWNDLDGVVHQTPVDTLRHLLRELSIDAETPDAARAACQRLTARHHSPRSHVVAADRAARLALGDGAAGFPARALTLTLEGGETLTITRPGGTAELTLPPLPAGIHRLADESDTHTIIAAPEQCYVADTIGHGEKSFGLGSHLYALRSDNDWGIGDFTTLHGFMTETAQAGGRFAGINPLHLMFVNDRERASPYQPDDRRKIDPLYLDVTRVAGAKPTAAELAEAARLRALSHVDYSAVWALKDRVLRRAFGGGDAKAYAAWLQQQAEGQLAAAVNNTGLAYGLYRDLALGSGLDSAEVKGDPGLFITGASLGAPPDAFARSGQVWGLPPMNPLELEARGFEPFRALLAANMRHAGMIRIDHVLGMARQFWVPQGAAGADGTYMTIPLEVMAAIIALESQRARCMVIGEDLGTVPEGLHRVMRRRQIFSCVMMWFERDGLSFRDPAHYPREALAALSSHDLKPFMGWRRTAAADDVAALERAVAQTGLIQPDLMAAAHGMVAASPCLFMQVQADDLTGETEPLNVPGTDRENPNWRRRLARPVGEITGTAAARAVLNAVREGGR